MSLLGKHCTHLPFDVLQTGPLALPVQSASVAHPGIPLEELELAELLDELVFPPPLLDDELLSPPPPELVGFVLLELLVLPSGAQEAAVVIPTATAAINEARTKSREEGNPDVRTFNAIGGSPLAYSANDQERTETDLRW